MRFSIEMIKERATQYLIKLDVPEAKANILVDSMVSADCCGVKSHGLRMFPSYVDKITKKQLTVSDISVLKSCAAFSLVDANNSIGAVSAYQSVELAVNKAKESGVHIVFARNCSTFGPAFFYTEMIANQGMIGIVGSNSPAAMAAYNGIEAKLGTNPIAFACPSATRGLVSFDMATSIVAKSKIGEAAAKHEKIPFGWAVDQAGNPTDDPAEAIKGFVLPMAGFKGYGLSLMLDLMAGLLSGSGYLDGVGKFYSADGQPMRVGQLFVAVNPQLIYSGNFLDDVDGYINNLRSSKSVDQKAIALPGDNRCAMRLNSQKYGVELSDDTVSVLSTFLGDDLREIAYDCYEG